MVALIYWFSFRKCNENLWFFWNNKTTHFRVIKKLFRKINYFSNFCWDFPFYVMGFLTDLVVVELIIAGRNWYFELGGFSWGCFSEASHVILQVFIKKILTIYPSSISLGFLKEIFKNCYGILPIYRKIF